VTPGTPRRLILLRQSPGSAAGYRANLGLVNVRPLPAVVEIELLDPAGRRLGVVTRALRPLESVQLGEVLRQVAPAGADDFVAVVRTPTPGAAILTYACLIDNRTNDPLLVAGQ
jgi:hypothetical protein